MLEWVEVVLEAELIEDGELGEPIDLLEILSVSFIADIIFSISALVLSTVLSSLDVDLDVVDKLFFLLFIKFFTKLSIPIDLAR